MTLCSLFRTRREIFPRPDPAPRNLQERRREFRQRLLPGSDDLKTAFDPTHREALRNILLIRENPKTITDLTAGLCCGAECCVASGWEAFPASSLNVRVMQGRVLAPSLFNTGMDWASSKVVDQSLGTVSVGEIRVIYLLLLFCCCCCCC